MSWTVTYNGDSSHLLEKIAAGLDDGLDWYIEVKYLLTSETILDGHYEAAVEGLFKYYMPGDPHAKEPTFPRFTLQPCASDAFTPNGEPITINVDDITELVIP